LIYARDGNRCAYCGQVFPTEQLSVDHFWPSFLGGTDDPVNFVTACLPCGKLKAHLPPLFFRQHRAALAAAMQDEQKRFAAVQRDESNTSLSGDETAAGKDGCHDQKA
jgi:5-methylcytosine-specific restriction endonuclease McrA